MAVVLFHFNPTWLSGGFAGVDIFFVISGFLMTKIIFTGIEQNNFSLWGFYKARAYRIIPALAVLCLFVMVFGWFFIGPVDYEELGKHISTSVGFVSNFRYWEESGYFDTASKGKWLLHTWSLSVEWQFYLIYPLIILILSKYLSFKTTKATILALATLGFTFNLISSYYWPSASYYLLPSRAWEMLLGGIAYLYPLDLTKLKTSHRKLLEILGVTLIIGSFLFISDDNSWPGYLSLIPTLGSFLIIQAHNNNSFFTGNFIFKHLGKWSYSIYLWHWPVVVSIYYLSIKSDYSSIIGIILSLLFGFLSYTYIESINFKNKLKYTPLILVLIIASLGIAISESKGMIERTSSQYQYLINHSISSPLTKKCHIDQYENPSQSCEYFGENITWAVLGDSHAIALAYTLAEKLKSNNEGVKHFTFSSCKTAYLESDGFSDCSKWYNESINYILDNKKIENIAINHRFITELFDKNLSDTYPKIPVQKITKETRKTINNFDKLIYKLASKKENVFLFYPIPELPKNIDTMINNTYIKNQDLNTIKGTSLNFYLNRNRFIINHFNNANYPKNVHILNIKDIFCDNDYCYAVRDGSPLYKDDNHPSLLAAEKMTNLINKIEN